MHDSSNQNPTYFRNRLRHELIPYLESFNPAIKRIIWRSSEVMRGENEIIHKVVEETMQDCVQQSGEGFVGFDATILSNQSTGMQPRLIRRAISDLRPGLRDVDFEAIDRAMKFLASTEKPDQIDLVSNLRLVFESGRLWLTDWEVELPTHDWPQMSDMVDIQFIQGGVINLAGNWQLQVEMITDAEIARFSRISSLTSRPVTSSRTCTIRDPAV